MTANGIKSQAIRFANGNEALAVFPAASDRIEDVVAKLGLGDYRAVILVLGGAEIDEKLIPRLTQMFGRGIARAAAEANAVLLDGGTQAGVMALMGEGVAGRGYKSTLIGVAPTGNVTYPGADSPDGVPLEPNHSRFILVEGTEWGSETASMFKLASALTSKPASAVTAEKKPRKKGIEKAAGKVPALATLAGGGETSRNEALRAVRHNLPLIVVEGSGGLADEIAAAWGKKETLPDDPVMAEIIADGEIHLHHLSNPVKGIERLIIRELGIDKVLMQAWEIFADYDLNANEQQGRFNRLQLGILTLGVLGTALAIIKQLYAPEKTAANQQLYWTLYYTLVIVPILLTVLVTAASRFKQGNKWLLLRAGAESLKREIFRYRARAGDYQQDPEQRLVQNVEDITRRTMRTEVNTSALPPYDKDKGFPPHMYGAQGGDDGFSYLTPDRYIEVRLGDQLNYFQKKSVYLEKQLRALYWLTFLIGGLGTYLAAIDQQVWIALTTAIVAAIGTYLGYRQTENTLTKYNQAATDLANVKAWWNALSAEEQAQQENVDSLVDHTEQVLQSELDGWVQQMQNALAELRKGQEPKTGKEENREPREPARPPEAEPPEGPAEAQDAAAGGKPNGEPKAPEAAAPEAAEPP
jgi:TRPM family ion channel/conflict system pore-forming effector with SLATT domain/uncharacterized protein DUF4231